MCSLTHPSSVLCVAGALFCPCFCVLVVVATAAAAAAVVVMSKKDVVLSGRPEMIDQLILYSSDPHMFRQ